MRLIGRGRSPEPSIASADVIFQIGDAKIPLKAERLLGASPYNNEDDDYSHSRPTAHAPTDNEQRAVKALTRMHETLSFPQAGGTGGGPWSPWSPDDLFPRPGYPQSGTHDQTSNDSSRQQSVDAAFASPYNPAEQPYYVAQQTSASAVRDMALHKAAPTIFDSLGEQTRSKTTSMPVVNGVRPEQRHGNKAIKKPRKLDLVHLFPHPKPSQGNVLSPSRRSRSPTALTDISGFPTPPASTERPSASFLKSVTSLNRKNTTSPRPSSGNSGGTSKSNKAEVVFQPKTNVRRPPKGIQNWFDAYISSDDDLEEEGEEADPLAELPASGNAPPTYRESAEHAPRHTRPAEREEAAMDYSPPGPGNQQSKHTRYRRDSESSVEPARDAVPRLTQQSMLTLSSSTSEEAPQNQSSHALPAVAARRRLTMPQNAEMANHLDCMLTTQDSVRSNATSGSIPMAFATRSRDKPLPLPPGEAKYHKEDRTGALRRLNGLSMNSQLTSDTATTFQDVSSRPPSSVAHIMAVTEEEKALLDMMRRKRAAMQQVSFTEGYQMALQREQKKTRVSTRSSAVGQANGSGLRQRHSTGRPSALINSYSEDEMRRKLSEMEEESEALKMSRFLEGQERYSSEHDMPVELPATKPGDEILSATAHTIQRPQAAPIVTVTPKAAGTDPKRQSKHQLASNDSISRTPPSIFKAKRQSHRLSSMPPALALEEGPEIPRRISSKRILQKNQPSLNQILVYSPSSSEPDTMSMLSSPTSGFHEAPQIDFARYVPDPPPKHEHRATLDLLSNPTISPPESISPLSSIITAAVPLARRSSTAPPTSDDRASRISYAGRPDASISQTSLPRQSRKPLPELKISSNIEERTSVASMTSASEEILAAWADLGGGSDSLPPRRRSRAPPARTM